MPRTAINYQNTVIYKIQHLENEELMYVGHTTDFIKRKSQHKICSYVNHQLSSLRLYTMIIENGGWDMFNMIELKKYPCNDKREAEAEEDRFIRLLKPSMNSKNSMHNKEKEKATQKLYRQTHQEEIAAKEKEYREKHKEHYRELTQKYYKEHYDELMEKRREIIMCSCGHQVSRYEATKTRHLESKKHKIGILKK